MAENGNSEGTRRRPYTILEQRTVRDLVVQQLRDSGREVEVPAELAEILDDLVVLTAVATGVEAGNADTAIRQAVKSKLGDRDGTMRVAAVTESWLTFRDVKVVRETRMELA